MAGGTTTAPNVTLPGSPLLWRAASYLLVASLTFVLTAHFSSSHPATSSSEERRQLNLVASSAAAVVNKASNPGQPTHAASSSGSGSGGSDDPKYHSLKAHPICKFLESGRQNPLHELRWGSHTMCNMTIPSRWLAKVGSNCYSCMTGANVCQQPPRVLYHQYLDKLHPTEWRGNLLAFQAYLMTQDLQHTELWVWADDVSTIVTNDTAWFFDAFRAHVTVKRFDHAAMLRGTAWEGDPFLGDVPLVRGSMKALGAYSDVVRLLLLWHHGGFWFDNDVWFLRDLYPLLSVAYQFSMRWTNAHVMLMQRGSQVLSRLMQLATTIPLNHPNFKRDVIDKKCRPVGYYQIVPKDYGYTDIYNGCLFRLLRHHNNTGGPAADLLHDMPLGWFDQEWPNCQSGREPVSDARWRELSSTYLALHTRYPKEQKLSTGCPTRRAKDVITAFFDQCRHAGCVPARGLPLLAFEGFAPGLARRPGRLAIP